MGRRRPCRVGAALALIIPLLLGPMLLPAASDARESRRHRPPRFQHHAYGHLDIVANVVPRCRVDTLPVIFPDYARALTQAAGAVRVTCSTRCDRFVIALGAGNHYAGGKERRMSDGANHFLKYILRTESGRLWGDRGYGNTYRQGDTVHGSSPGANVPAEFAVIATMPANQAATPGAYFDAVWVTLDF